MLLDRLLANMALRVEAFATCRVAPGWRLRLPDLDWVTFHFVVQGTGAYRDVAGTCRPLPPDALAIVPPRAPHAIESGQGPMAEVSAPTGGVVRDGIAEEVAGVRERAAFIVVCGRLDVRYGGARGLFDQMEDALILDFSTEPAMRPIFESLLAEQLRHEEAGGRQVMMTALMTQCLIHVFRRLCTLPECGLPWLQALEDERLGRAMQAVLDAPERSHTVESLARVAYMSRSAFAERWRAVFRRTPMASVREVRLRRAADLLRRDTALTVDQIAGRVGFSSRSRFSRAFREYFGRSPTRWREGTATPQ